MTDHVAADLDRHLRADLSIDQRLALKTAATRLQKEFAAMFGVETIERFLHSSHDQFATRASIANFLPLLAERFARQRLRALAKVEGKSDDGRPTVLFLCTHNAGRSQMALGFFTRLAGDAAVAWLAARSPAMRSTRPRSRRWPSVGSTYPASTPSRGPMRSSGPPTWSSPWDAVTRARFPGTPL